jgi:hypothetical protein
MRPQSPSALNAMLRRRLELGALLRIAYRIEDALPLPTRFLELLTRLSHAATGRIGAGRIPDFSTFAALRRV